MQMSLWSQRWRARRDHYRPSEDRRFDPSRHGVEPISFAKAKAFVVEHHYSGSYPADRVRLGLFRKEGLLPGPMLAGVAVFSVPPQIRAIPCYTGVEAGAGVELGRFVLLDHVERNGETWFLGQCFKYLRKNHLDIEAILSYADPIPRMTDDGVIVKPGHLGIIYQACNAQYHGLSSASTLTIAPDSRVVSRRTLSKIGKERGHDSAVAMLLEYGAPRKRRGESWPEWKKRALDEGPFIRRHHPGKHAYTWGLTKAAQRRMKPNPDCYPKGVRDE